MAEPFSFVAMSSERTTVKPRTKGITMFADTGMTLPELQDTLELAGNFIDYAKFFAGSIRLYGGDYLAQKIDLYRSHGIGAFTGGAFLEHALAADGLGGAERFLEEAVRLGLTAFEISDQTTVLSPEQRCRLIQSAAGKGLRVFAEVGSKAVSVQKSRLVEQAQAAFASGADMVTIEAAELLLEGKPNAALIGALEENLDLDRVLFEIPGPAVVGMTLSQAQELKRFLIRTVGPNVNLGNIRVGDLFDTEVRRVGLGPSGRLMAGMQQNVVKS